MRHPHLQPDPAVEPDPEGVAVLAFDRALRDGHGPRQAMRLAFEAAGVDQLEAQVEDLTAALADRRAAAQRAAEALVA